MKISVIVPVYNAEKYLKKCISSVMQQSHKNWELILVDDGSADDSPSMVDMAAYEDSRIIAIHQSNTGPGEARNRGIIEATGDYVVFIDSDDYINEDYFKLLVPKAQNNDVVYIDVNQVSPEGKLLTQEAMSTFKEWSKDQLLRSQLTGKIPWGGVRKAVRLSVLKENNIFYTNHKIGEEALYSFKILYAANKIAFLDEKAVYYYVNHENSQSKLKLIDPWGGVVETISQYLQEQNLYEVYANTLNAFNIAATVVSLDKLTQLYNGNDLKKHASDRMTQFFGLYDNTTSIDTANMSPKAKIFIPFITKGYYLPVIWCSKLRNNLRK